MKVNVRYRRFIHTALVIGPMTMLMAIVGVMRNSGLEGDWFLKIATTWITMFPIAYIFALFVIPVATHLTGKINFQE